MSLIGIFRSPFRPRRLHGPRAVVFLATLAALVPFGCASFRALERAENGWLGPCEGVAPGGEPAVGAYRQKQLRLKRRTIELLEVQTADPACQDPVFTVKIEGKVSSSPSELPLIRYRSRSVAASVYLLEIEEAFRRDRRCGTGDWEIGREIALDGRCGFPLQGAERTEDTRALSPAPAGCNCGAR